MRFVTRLDSSYIFFPGVSGLSRSVITNRDALIRSQIEAHVPNKERYTLVAREVFVGVALLVYARDSGIGRRVCDVQTNWTGCGPAWLVSLFHCSLLYLFVPRAIVRGTKVLLASGSE